MHLHRGDQPGIIGRLAGDVLFKHKTLPGGVERGRFPKHCEEALHMFNFPACRNRGQSQPVSLDRPCRHGPELNQILWHQVKAMVLGSWRCNRAIGDTVERMVRLESADKNVGIDQHARL